MKKTLLLAALLSASSLTFSQQKIDPDSIRDKMQWFGDAKLGIFIHWGIYAVNGIDESWSFHNKLISFPDYMKQLKGFTASRYDPGAWASLIKKSGARYAVVTTKHHDGVALWPTAQHHYSMAKNTPAKRDLLTPLYQALDKQGIKRGAYFSLIDWSYPDYPGFLKDSSRYDAKKDPARWRRFLDFYEAQIKEVSENFRPDLWWFDGDWEHSADEWEAPKVRNMILDNKPSAIINGRLAGYGDYDTPEQNFPVTRPHYNWWELCMTINSSWGYQQRDTAWKTPYEIITIFADVVSNGGNLLLDIGPREDGTIPTEQKTVLEELGKWNSKNGEGIFGTIAGIPQGHFYGPTTLSKDSSTLYLFLPGKVTGSIMVKGLMNNINKIRVLGSNDTLTHKVVGKISWSVVPGLVYIAVPGDVQDPYMTVLALDLDGPVRLYRGKGGFN